MATGDKEEPSISATHTDTGDSTRWTFMLVQVDEGPGEPQYRWAWTNDRGESSARTFGNAVECWEDAAANGMSGPMPEHFGVTEPYR